MAFLQFEMIWTESVTESRKLSYSCNQSDLNHIIAEGVNVSVQKSSQE